MDRTAPLAYFLTFAAYGTWLHGDDRGSRDARHRTAGTVGLRPSPGLQAWESARLKHPPQSFDAARRRVIRATISEIVEHRGWGLHAVKVRTNHVHLVVTADRQPEPVMNTFKSYATRRLREAGLFGPDEEVWARHGSTRYIWTEDQLHNVCMYARFGQGPDI